MTNIKEMEYFFITIMEKNMKDNFKKDYIMVKGLIILVIKISKQVLVINTMEIILKEKNREMEF